MELALKETSSLDVINRLCWGWWPRRCPISSQSEKVDMFLSCALSPGIDLGDISLCLVPCGMCFAEGSVRNLGVQVLGSVCGRKIESSACVEVNTHCRGALGNFQEQVCQIHSSCRDGYVTSLKNNLLGDSPIILSGRFCSRISNRFSS